MLLTEQVLNQQVLIRLEADCESYWEDGHGRRADCIRFREERVAGTVEMLDEDWCFVAFAGYNGHWFKGSDLELATERVGAQRAAPQERT